MDGNSKFQKLVDAGVIPDESAFDKADREVIEEELTDEVVDALIRVKAKIHGPGQTRAAHPKAIAF